MVVLESMATASLLLRLSPFTRRLVKRSREAGTVLALATVATQILETSESGDVDCPGSHSGQRRISSAPAKCLIAHLWLRVGKHSLVGQFPTHAWLSGSAHHSARRGPATLQLRVRCIQRHSRECTSGPDSGDCPAVYSSDVGPNFVEEAYGFAYSCRGFLADCGSDGCRPSAGLSGTRCPW